LLATAVALAVAAPAAARPLDKGWWVVVGSFPPEPWERQRDDVERMGRAAARCRLKIFNDFSGKFRGFAPGHNVFVLGAFGSKAQAEARARAARPCFPGAYVKYGAYAGE
jgi:hypothetical protein